jgi:hypothetical protein
MIKPILKIELPFSNQEQADKQIEYLDKHNAIMENYHILVIFSPNEYVSVEIITASDISIHKPEN